MPDSNDVHSTMDHVTTLQSQIIKNQANGNSHKTTEFRQASVDSNDKTTSSVSSLTLTVDLSTNSGTRVLPMEFFAKSGKKMFECSEAKVEPMHRTTMDVLAFCDSTRTADSEVLAVPADVTEKNIYSTVSCILEPRKRLKSRNSLEACKLSQDLPQASTKPLNFQEPSSEMSDFLQPGSSTGCHNSNNNATSLIKSNKRAVETPGDEDIFGHSLTSKKYLSKMTCPCPHCGRKTGATRFTFHLSRCMNKNGRRSRKSARK